MARSSQPYRAGGARPPGPVLEKMLAGRATPSPGAGKALAKGMKAAPVKKPKLLMPRY